MWPRQAVYNLSDEANEREHEVHLGHLNVLLILSYCPHAHQSRGKYEVVTGTYKNGAEMVDLYVELLNKYPSIIALIDPFRKEVSRTHLLKSL